MTSKITEKIIAIKIDVDTDRGTRIGVANLLNLFEALELRATFLFSLGPDNTGRAIKRIFRPGFLQKVNRSHVISNYGIRTLLNGTLLPAPHIGKRNEKIIYKAYRQGHEVGIHCYDHNHWQDNLATMSEAQVDAEFTKARSEFQRIFGFAAQTAGAAGWQANAFSLSAYDKAQLLYATDTRGKFPFFPRINATVFTTLQIPTNLPTLDELLGRADYPLNTLADFYFNLLENNKPNVLTIHAELEGMKYLAWFKDFLQRAQSQQIKFVTVAEIAEHYLMNKHQVPICDLAQHSIDGRSGTLSVQVV